MFASSDLKEFCESLGLKRWRQPSTIHELAVQTGKWAVQVWSPNLNVSSGALLQRALITRRNTFKTRGKTPVGLVLGRKMRLPAVTDFDICECNISFEMNSDKPMVSRIYPLKIYPMEFQSDELYRRDRL